MLMNKLISLLLVVAVLGCSQNAKQTETPKKQESETKNATTESYQLFIPVKQEGFIILFPCLPCDAMNTMEEFNIVDLAIENNIAVLLMNFNQHLWLSETEKKELDEVINTTVGQNNINA